MSKFRFRLEKLLRLREQNEKNWENKLGEITSKCVQTRRRILNNNHSASTILVQRAHGGTDINTLLDSELYMRRMRDENTKLTGELEKLETKRLAVQEKFLEASRERKTIQKLKEKKEKEFSVLQAKKEFYELDDINNSAAIRKKVGGR